MHITPDFAELLAQVFPALLIAILLEGKLPKPDHEIRWPFVIAHSVKFVAVIGGTASTFFCLYMVGTSTEAEFFDWAISISGAAMFSAMFCLAGLVLGPEQQGALSLLKKLPVAEPPKPAPADIP